MAVDPAVQIKVTSIVCSAVAIGTTIYRLIIRRRRLWVDDVWACFSMASLVVQVVAVYLDVRKNTSQRYKVVRYYMMANAFYCIIWSARLSILFSMIRIDPSRTRQRRLACVGAAFFTTWVLLVAQLFWVCEPNDSWKKLKTPQCPLDEQVAIFQLVCKCH
ncbi:hypothetical protein BDZ94DRAFT_326393 [Collybia nuda]|uniref:Uncharacterized protein n=1 Tax=Collybia nuda TaxID=64659 RepID=A0A9P5YAA3_9AGAR|nr:hypothetical protein BDZ94DRAFT_326393 [Collybia nuda]